MKGAILEKDLLFNIKTARANWTSFTLKLLEFKTQNNIMKEKMKDLAVNRMKDYLLALDYACDKYHIGLIDKTSFDRNFLDIILTVKKQKHLLQKIKAENNYNSLKRYLGL